MIKNDNVWPESGMAQRSTFEIRQQVTEEFHKKNSYSFYKEKRAIEGHSREIHKQIIV